MTIDFVTTLQIATIIILTTALIFNFGAMMAMVYRQIMLYRELRSLNRFNEQFEKLQLEQMNTIREAMQRAQPELNKDTKH